jgi:CRISPR-associated protein Csd1
MIIQALNRYYQILAESNNSQIPSYGYCNARVGFALVISEDGELLDLISLKETAEKNKKLISKFLIVPEQKVKSSNISANFMCGNSKYIFGIDKNSKPAILEKAFKASKELHLQILNNAKGKPAKAILAFLNKWNIKEAKNNEVLKKYMQDIIKGDNLVFKLDGEIGYLHDDSEIKKLWEVYIANSEDEDGIKGQCLVTGEIAFIPRLHPRIKNIKGIFTGGTPLVSFNESAYESYGKEKSYNSPTSKKATFAYTTVLNQLLSNQRQKIHIGDTTTVFWAESPQDIYPNFAAILLNPSIYEEKKIDSNRYERDQKTESLVKDVLFRIKKGMIINDFTDKIDMKTKFYILGLSAANKARITVRYFFSDTFGGFVEKVAQHYKDMELVKDFSNRPDNIPIWMLLKEIISPKSKDNNTVPLLAGSLMRSIINGHLYPVSFFNATIGRIKRDVDDKDNKINRLNYIRAAIIKAYLIRKARIQNNENLKEVLSVSLNEKTTNVEYLLGRLFAVLEKAQQDTNPDLNKTIKDRYFSSASATPAVIFPILLKLTQHHIAKSDYKYVAEKRISEIMNQINEFPFYLTLEKQGIFALGYYHQRVALFQKSNKREEE